MRLKAFALAFALMLSLTLFAESQGKSVWHVGVFDASSDLFKRALPIGAEHHLAGART